MPEEAGAMLFRSRSIEQGDEVLRPGRCSGSQHTRPNNDGWKNRLDSVCCVSCVTMCHVRSSVLREEEEKDLGLGGSSASVIVQWRTQRKWPDPFQLIGLCAMGTSEWHPHFNLSLGTGRTGPGCRQMTNGSYVEEQLRQSMGLARVRNFLNWIHPPEVVSLMRAKRPDGSTRNLRSRQPLSRLISQFVRKQSPTVRRRGFQMRARLPEPIEESVMLR